MNSVKKIAIVTTRQNFKWVSMREILPCIEECWRMASSSMAVESRVINVDSEPLREYVHFLIEADVIVVVAFNETVAKLMRQIRLSFGIDAPFILHLFGHGTLGLWPQKRYGVLEVMNQGDVFVGTCPGDIACMKVTSPTANAVDIPFPYFPLSSRESFGEKKFAYIGRISDQKNLNILVEAYRILNSKIKDLPQLIIYGEEDFFGSPNMGIPSTECLKNLKVMIAEYKLDEKIVFRGFVDREIIYQELSKNHVFVSASTHSDENFGMALMRSISIGSTAVVSDWGGHKVFKKYCSQKVKTVPVYFEEGRPVVSAEVFAEQMLEAYQESDGMGQLSEYFSPANIAKDFIKMIGSLEINNKPLVLSFAAETIYQQQQEFESQGNIQKAFTSYLDPIAHLYLSAYAL